MSTYTSLEDLVNIAKDNGIPLNEAGIYIDLGNDFPMLFGPHSMTIAKTDEELPMNYVFTICIEDPNQKMAAYIKENGGLN